LGYFFKGMQNKETSASAWLATMLRYDERFRRQFMALVRVDPPLDPSDNWTVQVETELNGPCDITLESDTTFVFLENKVSASSKTERQFLRYYLGAQERSTLAAKRLVGIYLGPSASIGEDELYKLTSHPSFSLRAVSNGDAAVCLGWKDNVADVVELATADDDWFARTGIAAILAHIAKLEAGRQPNPQREFLRALMWRVRDRVIDGGGAAQLDRWASIGQEALYTRSVPITTFITLSYDEDLEEPHELHDVVDLATGEVHVRASVSLNPSAKQGQRSPALMSRWQPLIAADQVRVGGVGELHAVNEVTLAVGQDYSGPARELEDLPVRWATGILQFGRSVSAG
jgi:hypothetical protein